MVAEDGDLALCRLVEERQYRLGELCQLLGVSAEWVMEMVNEAIIEPAEREPTLWCFSREDLQQLRRARNLERELQINLPGIALALDLLDELEHLRRIIRLSPHLAEEWIGSIADTDE